ncbi:MAG: aa3-type cytochrome oxidase subunit IV [Candidatus Tyrphobacter sp.]
MKTFSGLFIIAGVFGFFIDVAYWFIAKVEPAGVALLSIMTIGLIFAAVYAYFAERDAKLEGDDPNTPLESVAGEEVEIFTTNSTWPIVIALSTLATLTGIIWSPMLAGLGLLSMLYAFYRLGRESARF